jgi:tRNA pseudouridine38-40 synthase
VRTVTSIDVARAWELIRIEVRGPGFLYMMVRNITAALVEVGAGRRAAGWISEVLERRERPLLPPPAPAAGLTLVEVSYGDGFPGSATRDKKRPPPPRR